MTPYDFLASLWRTVVPMIVGALVAVLAHVGIGVDSAAATTFLGTAFSSVYYAGFRWLEQHVSTKWGWLLGLAKPPAYTKSTPTVTAVAAAPQPPAGA